MIIISRAKSLYEIKRLRTPYHNNYSRTRVLGFFYVESSRENLKFDYSTKSSTWLFLMAEYSKKIESSTNAEYLG